MDQLSSHLSGRGKFFGKPKCSGFGSLLRNLSIFFSNCSSWKACLLSISPRVASAFWTPALDLRLCCLILSNHISEGNFLRGPEGATKSLRVAIHDLCLTSVGSKHRLELRLEGATNLVACWQKLLRQNIPLTLATKNSCCFSMCSRTSFASKLRAQLKLCPISYLVPTFIPIGHKYSSALQNGRHTASRCCADEILDNVQTTIVQVLGQTKAIKVQISDRSKYLINIGVLLYRYQDYLHRPHNGINLSAHLDSELLQILVFSTHPVLGKYTHFRSLSLR